MASRSRSELSELRHDDSRARGESALATLIRGRKHVRKSVIPARDEESPDVPFVWVVLSGREKQESVAGACARFAEIGIPDTLRTYNDLEHEVRWQCLAMAMRSPDNEGTDVEPYPDQLDSVDNVRNALTIDERDVLLAEYYDLEEKVDPDPALMPEQWHDDIEHALKKSLEDMGEAEKLLSNFGSRALLSYLLITVAPLLGSQTGRSGSLFTDGQNNNPRAQATDPNASE